MIIWGMVLSTMSGTRISPPRYEIYFFYSYILKAKYYHGLYLKDTLTLCFRNVLKYFRDLYFEYLHVPKSQPYCNLCYAFIMTAYEDSLF